MEVCGTGGAARVAATAGALLGLAWLAGGLGVTRGRHDERAAKTPWYRTSGKSFAMVRNEKCKTIS
jgi:hypothetical protein